MLESLKIAFKMKNVLLITGGTGSFGNAVLNRFLKTDYFTEIRIFSRDEKKQDDLRKRVNNNKVKFYIGDVRDRDSLIPPIKGVDYIFHAAALKDKAAYPINAMGMSKALMEKVMVAKSRILDSNKTIFCGTRYGNVMASRGSVIPLFIDQIKENKALTLTDSNMTRFMMTLEDAVDLVLYAFEHANQGDLFVQKAPSETVGTLAQALIELYKSSSQIKVIGTRHGEKLYETLVNREDMIKAEDLGEYYRIPADNRDLNYEQYFSEGMPDIANLNEYHSHNTAILDVEGMKQLLLKLPIIRKDILGEVDAIQYPY